MGTKGGNGSSFVRSREGFLEEVTLGLDSEGCAEVPQVGKRGNGILALGTGILALGTSWAKAQRSGSACLGTGDLGWELDVGFRIKYSTG